LERREELRALLNAYPYPALAFEPPPSTDAGRVLLASDRLESILDFLATEACRLSLQHFFSLESVSLLEEGLKRLAAGKSVFRESAKFRTKRGLPVDGRMTLATVPWCERPLGLCFIEAVSERSSDRPSEGKGSTAPLEYPSLVHLDGDIRSAKSDLYVRLRAPLDKSPTVEVKVTRPPSAKLIENPSENPNVKAKVHLLNMVSKDIDIPEGKRLLIVCAEDGGGWLELADLAREGKSFKPSIKQHAS
jgi:hypothetical protein